jgi:hypothetical protein
MKAAKQPNIQIWPIERLLPYELNTKKHTPEQVNKIAESIREFGFDQPFSCDKSGSIIKGHGRRLACLQLGIKEVPVWVRDDLTPNQVRASRLADNRVAIGDIDTELFRKEIASLNHDLTKYFDEKELEFAMTDLGAMNNDAFIDDVNAEVTAQEAATHSMVDALDNRRVPLSKAFGFKDVLGADEIYISRFMSQIEIQSGQKGEQALVAFIKGLVGDLSHE